MGILDIMSMCLVVFLTQKMMVRLRRLEFVPRLSYFCFVMFYVQVYGQSGPSLLIESTDSMIKAINVSLRKH